MQIHERIKFVRESKNITQKEIAEALNMQQTHYSKYERGLHEMSITRLKEICQYLGVSADYILGLPKNLWHPPIK